VAVVVVSLAAMACSSSSSGSAVSSTTSSSTTTTALDPGPGPTSLDGVGIRLETIVAPLPEVVPGTTTTTLPDTPEPTDLDAPIAMAVRPGRNQLWIAERGGTVRILTVNTAWDRGRGRTVRTGQTLLPGFALDMSALTDTTGERGLLGLAFSTDGRTLYVDHTALNGDIVVAAYTVTDKSVYSGGTDGPPPRATSVAEADPNTRIELLTIPHQENANHNGGQLVLGPDGFLYIGVGDGGGSGDPQGNAQDPDSLLGTVLRIDPATVTPLGPAYAVPADNPFVAGGGRSEIHLWGVRNPWRFSFDQANGDLWVADVGESAIEEINWLPADAGAGRGANLGWNWFEGTVPFRTDGTPPEGLVDPLHVYGHSGGRCSIIGGQVYRGSAIEGLDGTYLYGDHCTGEIRGLLARRGIVLDDAPLASVAANSLVSFGQDEDGEIYVLSADGTLSKIVA
jgi:glucose/arabinose dehydrogenase